MKGRTVLFLGVFGLILTMPVLGMADDILVPDPILSFISQVIAYLESSFPIVGEIVKWIGVVATVATALSYALQAVLVIPEIAARWAGAHDVADKLKYWSDKVVYWLKFISIRNAQKVVK